MTLTDATARWFQDRRGIDRATLDAFGIESEGEGVSIPYPDGAVKHRKTLEKVDGKHKMWFDPRTPDGHQRLFLPPNYAPKGKYKIVWEGESDTMASWQAAPETVQPFICGVGGAGAFGDKGLTDEQIEMHFGDCELVFFVLDNEDPYQDKDAWDTVQRAKAQIRAKIGAKARFVELPGSTQDGAEFFMTFDWEAFSILVTEAKKVQYHFKAIDFSKPRPERDWLIEGMIAKGEIVLVSGDGGTGKSLLLTDLAAHIARGEKKWLGQKLDAERVMIIDQENSDVEVWDRLFALGFKPEHADRLRYIWYQSILLDNPETVAKLYEDVAHFGPSVLVLDSMSRMHLKNENAVEDMNPLINGAIYPLARQLGITIIIIHHTRKDGRTRGSTAIRNAVDLALDVLWDSEEKNHQIVRPDKPRAITARDSDLLVTKLVDDNGNITLTTEEDTPY